MCRAHQTLTPQWAQKNLTNDDYLWLPGERHNGFVLANPYPIQWSRCIWAAIDCVGYGAGDVLAKSEMFNNKLTATVKVLRESPTIYGLGYQFETQTDRSSFTFYAAMIGY